METLPKLAYGQETARFVLEKIRQHPELHDQDSWWGGDSLVNEDEVGAFYSCGTTHCVAGWVAFLHRDLTAAYLEQEVAKIAQYPGASQTYLLTRAIPQAAVEALEITPQEGDAIFTAGNEQAIKALEYLAAGEEIDWSEVDAVPRFDPEGYDLPV